MECNALRNCGVYSVIKNNLSNYLKEIFPSLPQGEIIKRYPCSISIHNVDLVSISQEEYMKLIIDTLLEEPIRIFIQYLLKDATENSLYPYIVYKPMANLENLEELVSQNKEKSLIIFSGARLKTSLKEKDIGIPVIYLPIYEGVLLLLKKDILNISLGEIILSWEKYKDTKELSIDNFKIPLSEEESEILRQTRKNLITEVEFLLSLKKKDEEEFPAGIILTVD